MQANSDQYAIVSNQKDSNFYLIFVTMSEIHLPLFNLKAIHVEFYQLFFISVTQFLTIYSSDRDDIHQ